MSDELRECPFCGGPAKLVQDDSCDYRSGWTWFVICQNPDCWCEGNHCYIQEEALAAWNHRTPAAPEPDWDCYPFARYAWLTAWSGAEVSFRWCYCAEPPTGDTDKPYPNGEWCYGNLWIPVGELVTVYQVRQRPEQQP